MWVAERYGIDAQALPSDDGIVLRIPETDQDAPGAEVVVFDPDEIEDIVTTEVGGSTDRQKIVSTIETMGDIKFASLPFGFTADRHLSKTMDDLIVVTLERSTGPAKTDPPYELGTEWKEVLPAGYVGPTHLVRPTLEANKRKHPDVMDEVIRLHYGTQCTAACKVH